MAETHLHRDAHYSTRGTVIICRDLPRYTDANRFYFLVVPLKRRIAQQGRARGQFSFVTFGLTRMDCSGGPDDSVAFLYSIIHAAKCCRHSAY